MKYFLTVLFAVTYFFTQAQEIPACSMDDVITRTSGKDTLYIINFWATWCAPCVHELPEFNALQKRYAVMPVKVILVSLDFKEDYPHKLARFIERQRLAPQVWWLSDTDPNIFVPKVDKAWEGSIPATVIVYPGKGFKKFIEGTITEQQVSAIADRVLKQ